MVPALDYSIPAISIRSQANKKLTVVCHLPFLLECTVARHLVTLLNGLNSLLIICIKISVELSLWYKLVHALKFMRLGVYNCIHALRFIRLGIYNDIHALKFVRLGVYNRIHALKFICLGVYNYLHALKFMRLGVYKFIRVIVCQTKWFVACMLEL